MLFPLASASLLSLADPLGDAVGDGSLVAPTAEGFSRSLFDVEQITVTDAPTFSFQLELASQRALERSAGLQPITELYLDSEPGGVEALLPGSGMQLARGGWEVAFRMIGDRLTVFAPEASGELADVTASLGAQLTREGDTLRVTTQLAVPRRFSLFGMVGSYDPFSETGWRNVSVEPAPWRFSSPSQTLPVIDVIADDPDLQARAIRSGTLPEIRASFRQQRWLLVAVIGALIALVGLVFRFFVPAEHAPEATTPQPAPSTPPKPVVSYGAREAGERAQILRSIDFETLETGGWLEPHDNVSQLVEIPGERPERKGAKPASSASAQATNEVHLNKDFGD